MTRCFARLVICLSTLGSMTCLSSLANAQEKKVVFLAGKPSHGYGAHEHLAGCRVLADAIQTAAKDVKCEVYSGGWPEDESVLADADTIVMYCDGGGRHPALQHLDTLARLLEDDTGFVCLHYGVEVPPDNGGKEFLEWLGGYFEIHWSVNPHWTANFEKLPEHPITQGISPFAANDEWYFHMRFRAEMDGITPILSAVPPAETMRRRDGPHSGNPAVRKEVANSVPQHTAWAFERPNGGRSFGFTGGHYHWNWGQEDILKLVSNAIVWTAGAEVPVSGLQVVRPTLEKLESGQDEDIPAKHDSAATAAKFNLQPK